MIGDDLGDELESIGSRQMWLFQNAESRAVVSNSETRPGKQNNPNIGEDMTRAQHDQNDYIRRIPRAKFGIVLSGEGRQLGCPSEE